MYHSVILPLAKDDILDAALWYNKQSPGLGRRFSNEVREIVVFIRQNPTVCTLFNPVGSCAINHLIVFSTFAVGAITAIFDFYGLDRINNLDWIKGNHL